MSNNAITLDNGSIDNLVFIIELHSAILSIELNELQYYYSMQEEDLQTRRAATTEKFEKVKDQLDFESHIDLLDDLAYHKEKFPQLLHGAFLIQIFTTFEIFLEKVCDSIKLAANQQFAVNELGFNGGFLLKVQKYIKRILKIDINNYSDWSFIKSCYLLRNKYVHSMGVLDSQKDKQALQFINSVDFIESKLVSKSANGEKYSFLILNRTLNENLISYIERLSTWLLINIKAQKTG